MSESWYYVKKKNRHGPVSFDAIKEMVAKDELSPDDSVWTKGFDNWKKVRDVPELKPAPAAPAPEPEPELPPEIEKISYKDVRLSELSEDERNIFIRIGNDRGVPPTDYGPFSLKQLKQLFKENRINGKTFLFVPGMKEWKVLADFPEYQEVFEETPPVIQESDRRITVRKPFIARLFVQSNRSVFEGICRDISIGGMQVLLDNFEGKAGDRITINVHPENSDHHFTASGEVVRLLEGKSGFSFRFQGLTDEARRAIEKYLQAH
jgi:hypothetical protein